MLNYKINAHISILYTYYMHFINSSMDIMENISFYVLMQKEMQKGLEKHEAELGSCSYCIYLILCKFIQTAHALYSKQEKENNCFFPSLLLLQAGFHYSEELINFALKYEK